MRIFGSMNRKRHILFLVVFTLVVQGCDFSVALSTTPARKIDEKLLGVWKGHGKNIPDTITIIKKDEWTYLIDEEEGEDKFSFRAFHVKAKGFKLLQLEWTPTKEAENTHPQRFMYFSYEVDEDELKAKKLNNRVVSRLCQTREELIKDLKVHRRNTNLFNGLVFTKVK